MRDRPDHLVIRASAGSGKTYRLSNRYLQLLAAGARPDEVLATTFTRKAAGEILGRVLTRLADAAVDERGAKELAAALEDPSLDLPRVHGLLAQLCASIHCVAIGTLDSFFHRMANCFRFELGLSRRLQIIDEGHPTARQLRRRAIDAMLGDDDLPVMIELLRRLQHDSTQRRITDALEEEFAGLYHVYRQTQPEAWRRLVPPPWLERDALIEALALLRDAGAGLTDARFAKAWRENRVAAEQGDWQGFVSGGLAKRIAAGDDSYYNKPIPPDLLAAYRPLIAHAKAAIVRGVIDRTAATFDLLRRFDEHYRRLRREHGLLLFSDVPLMLARMMPAGPGDDRPTLEPLYYRLDGRVQHLLLDEFQDTSPLQWSILRPFAEEIRAGAGSAREGGPRRSFFCVGDVKQAIYGWRDGCAEVFDQVVADLHLPAGAQETLATSRRTAPVVLDVVNEVFENIADLPPLAPVRDAAAAWGSGFVTHEAHHADRQGFVEMVASPVPGDDEDAAAVHADFVADKVRQLVERHPARTIGVLVRQNRTAADLLNRLRQRGVAASGEGGAPLYTDPAVETVLAALTLADHPGHTAAAFRVLHSPLAEVVGLRSLEPAHLAEVSRAIRRSLLHGGYGGTMAAWARRLCASCNARSVERLTQLIELGERFDAAATLRPGDFVRFVEATPMEDPAPAAVRVMTVHKAKGLEFDAVVLAELGDLIGQASRLTVWQLRPNPTEPAWAVYRSVNRDLRAIVNEYDSSVGDAYEQEVARRVADDLSALYVAMTRPKHALHIVLEPLGRTKDGWSTVGLNNQSAASILRHALTDVDHPEQTGLLLARGNPAWDDVAAPAPAATPEPPPLVTPRFVEGPPRRTWPAVAPSRLADAAEVRAGELLSAAGSEARRRGQAAHDALAAVTWLDETDLDGLPAEAREALASAEVRELFVRPAGEPELWREQPFAVRLEGVLVNGRFDRVVVWRDAQGEATRAVLIDFKTDRVDPAGLDEAAARHVRQIEAYRKVLSVMLHLPAGRVEARLAFVHAGVVRAV